MSRPLFRIGLAVALVATLVTALEQAPELLARVPIFEAKDHEFHGLTYLTEEAVLRTAGIGPDANLWEDPAVWEERLERHPLVAVAQVERRFPGTLVIRVEERRPVGLVPTPVLAPVDAEGRYLPLDPSRFPLDYPILRPARGGVFGEGKPASIHVRPLARAAAALRSDPEFWTDVSEIRIDHHGAVEVRWGQPEIVFQFPPQVESRRIRVGMAAVADAQRRAGDRRLLRVDQRFGDHVTLEWDREGAP